MPPAKFRRQTPDRENSHPDGTRENGTKGSGTSGESEGETPAPPSTEGTVELLIEDIVESRTAGLREELEALRTQLESVEDFARISLNERKVKQNEAKLSEFSASLTAFAEKSFNNINALEDRLDRQALALAAVLESVDDDVDLSAVHRYENDRLVADRSPEERLQAAVGGRGEPVDTVDGIGSTYADRLEGAGIGSTAELAGADPGTVAEATGASEERAATWIDRA